MGEIYLHMGKCLCLVVVSEQKPILTCENGKIPFIISLMVSILSETQGEADHRASHFSRSVHPAGLPGLPGCACTCLPESGGVVVLGVAVLCGDHSHHRRLRGLRTRYWRTRCREKPAATAEKIKKHSSTSRVGSNCPFGEFNFVILDSC